MYVLRYQSWGSYVWNLLSLCLDGLENAFSFFYPFSTSPDETEEPKSDDDSDAKPEDEGGEERGEEERGEEEEREEEGGEERGEEVEEEENQEVEEEEIWEETFKGHKDSNPFGKVFGTGRQGIILFD